MKIAYSEFVTEISEITALEELLSVKTGSPCLLIVQDDGQLTAGNPEALHEFFAAAPFLTALASENPDPETTGFFDMIIPPQDTQAYAAALFRDKTPMQNREITACFVTARSGTAEDVLTSESRAFYRLVAEKNRGDSLG